MDLVDDVLFEGAVASAVVEGVKAAVIVDAQIGTVSGFEADKVAPDVLHVEFGVSSIMVAGVKVRASGVIETEVVVIVGSNFDDVVVQVLDSPPGLSAAIAFEPERAAAAVSCEGLAVDS